MRQFLGVNRIKNAVRNESTGCLELQPYSGKIYPELYWPDAGRALGAHRVAWMLANGPIPPGMCVCHHCDNPRCVELSHLFLGTMADNMRDRDRKGRCGTIGENAHTAKLNRGTVLEIAGAIESGVATKTLCRIYGVSHQTNNRIQNPTTWRHLWADLQSATQS